MAKTLLVLEDGTYYEGKSNQKDIESYGEVVFNTSMTGYQEILTDPSYKGQIVVMTYPLIGNYGFTSTDDQSYAPHVQGLVAREICDFPSNFRCQYTPNQYLKDNNIPCIFDIDTRHLTRHIRQYGSMYGVITNKTSDVNALCKKAKQMAELKQDLVSMVTLDKVRHIEGDGKRIAVMDFGVKERTIKILMEYGCEVFVVPADTSANNVLDLNPDGILFSNGPGDPKDVPYAIDTIKKLIDKKPAMGICLGTQLMGLALGGNTYKLKFGHHGGNHPVKDLTTNKIYITCQNHNYALEQNFSKGAEITHINLNDDTVEGFKHNEYPVMGVQYHPESAPGPQDSLYIFDDFFSLIDNN